MSVMIQIPVALSPLPAAPKAPSARAVADQVVAFVRAAFARAVMPSYAERHAKAADVLSSSRLHGYGRDSFGWSDIGYRL